MPRTSPSRLHGKAALITGGSQGIGFAIASALAAEGCKVIITGRSPKALSQAQRRLKVGRVLPMICDVRDAAAVDALAQGIKSEFRRLDILINNAGISHPQVPVGELPLETWNNVITTNLSGMFLITSAVLPLMLNGGSIVNNLSVAAKSVFAGQAAYCASKHGALGFTNTLREELRSRGIRVIALMPGATHTAIWNQFWPGAPRNKMISPATVATAVLNALTLPAESTVEELVLVPSAGAL